MVSTVKQLIKEFCQNAGVFDWKEWHAINQGFWDGFSPWLHVSEGKAWSLYETEWHYYRIFNTIGRWSSILVWLWILKSYVL